MTKTNDNRIRYYTHQLDYPLYKVEEVIDEGGEPEVYWTLILTGSETVIETMTLREYIYRAERRDNEEYWMADSQVPAIQKELEEMER